MFFMPWPWGLRMILVVCGFWGLFCFGLPGPHFFCCGGWVGPGLVFWTVVLTLGSGWLFVCGWLGLEFCWFCLESLILAQDERWRRA